MGQVDIPEDPAPNGYVPNPYHTELQNALEYVKRECDSTEGWSSIGTKEDVVMEKKTIEGDPSTVPLVRGMGTLKGVKLADIIPVITHPGARKFWDARYVDGHALERYSRRAYHFYTLQKGSFMVQPRDFVGAQDLFEENGTYYLTQCSVANGEKTPDASGKTRGWLTAAGWRIRPSGENGENTDLSYICKVDPKGSLPSAIVNIVVQEIPNCVVNVINWVGQEGLIPYVASPTPDSAIKSVFRLETYSHTSSKTYKLAMICAGDETLGIKIDNAIKYKDGYQVSVEGEAKDWVKLEQKEDLVEVHFQPESDGKKVEIFISAK